MGLSIFIFRKNIYKDINNIYNNIYNNISKNNYETEDYLKFINI